MASRNLPRSITPEALKAYAHPLRLEMIRYLGDHGPQTATSLAKALGESTGQTSYHLRQLEKHGLVEEDVGRGKGRERWWRATSFSVDVPALTDPSAVPAARLMLSTMVRHRAEALLHWVNRDSVPEGWEAATHHSSTLALTPEELARLNEAVEAAMEPFERLGRERRESGEAEGMTRVRVYYDAFPLMED